MMPAASLPGAVLGPSRHSADASGCPPWPLETSAGEIWKSDFVNSSGIMRFRRTDSH